MKNLYLLLFTLLLHLAAKGQVFWSENFNNSCASGCTAIGYSSANGSWTQTVMGLEGTDPNEWYVSCAENGYVAGNCGTGCVPLTATATGASLHIGASVNWFGDIGAAYDAGGLCGILSCPQTNRRIESPAINCTGQSTITLSFTYIKQGAAPNDDAEIWYFDGATWTFLANPPATNNGPCAPQGQWTNYTVALPASANNNANVKIGFRWVNNDDGVGTDPSIAIDNMELSTPPNPLAPVVAFSASDSSICVGDCISFTDLTTNSPTAWSWSFPGSATATSAVQNPANICYNTPGTYAVTLTATNANGTGTLTQTAFITVSALPTASAGAGQTVCTGQPATLTGTGGGTYLWQPGNLTTASITVTPAATTTYTLTVTNAAGCTGTAQVTVTVIPCVGPIAAFTASDLSICVGDCINFTDQSTGPPTSWSWTFTGAATASSTVQNPTNICYNSPGTYAVTLTVTNANGSNTLTQNSYITVNPPPLANAGSNQTVCSGQPATLTGSGGVSYNWQPGNLSGATVTVTPATTTTYTLTVTDANGCTATSSVTVTVQPCVAPVAQASASDQTLCEGDCISFSDLSTGAPSSWSWQFPGGTPASSTQQNPGSVCYASAGVYDVILIVTNTFGSDTITLTNYINVAAPPVLTVSSGATIGIGSSLQLTATGTGTYSWAPSAGLSCTSCASPVASPTVNTVYTVTLTNANGCTSSDTVRIQVIEAYGLFVPSAFSPNDDGANDVLFVYGPGIRTLEFIVFNRNGEIVFETTSQTVGWDGTHRDKPVNTGIYAYFLRVEYFDGRSETRKGDISVVR
ncbi:MAG: PKD domain-containing protein [Bacteroidetes bacterium]|nr:PKD domain-containing protein [Bacteroidota bacterium]